MRIQNIDIRDANTAAAVLNIQLPAYRVEAAIIGVEMLPPLKDTIESLQACGEAFYGYYAENEALAGAISWEWEQGNLRICRMMVHPDHFRQGIAGQLLRHVLNAHPAPKTIVTTGAVNVPALNLYKANGFVHIKNISVGPSIDIAWLERES